jgi:hypothetical protein
MGSAHSQVALVAAAVSRILAVIWVIEMSPRERVEESRGGDVLAGGGGEDESAG